MMLNYSLGGEIAPDAKIHFREHNLTLAYFQTTVGFGFKL